MYTRGPRWGWRRSPGHVLASGILRRRSRASCEHTEVAACKPGWGLRREPDWPGPRPRTSSSQSWRRQRLWLSPRPAGFLLVRHRPESFPGAQPLPGLHRVCCLQLPQPQRRTRPESAGGEPRGWGQGTSPDPRVPPASEARCSRPAHPLPDGPARMTSVTASQPLLHALLPRASCLSPAPRPSGASPGGALEPATASLALSFKRLSSSPFPTWSWEAGDFSENRELGLQAGPCGDQPASKKPEKKMLPTAHHHQPFTPRQGARTQKEGGQLPTFSRSWQGGPWIIVPTRAVRVPRQGRVKGRTTATADGRQPVPGAAGTSLVP